MFQQSKWGGVVADGLAGQFDPCYHLACDSYGINGHPDNINNEVLAEMSDAVAHSVLTFAQTTSAVERHRQRRRRSRRSPTSGRATTGSADPAADRGTIRGRRRGAALQPRSGTPARRTRVALPGEEAGGSAFPELTRREREVLGLIADGRTNRQIAGRWFITEKTASVHVSSILSKLGAANRGEAAALAHRAGFAGET